MKWTDFLKEVDIEEDKIRGVRLKEQIRYIAEEFCLETVRNNGFFYKKFTKICRNILKD